MAHDYLLRPEVAGELGPRTTMDTTVHPPRVQRLHFVVSDWLGDDLLECFPCFLVSQRLAETMRASGLTGFLTDDVLVELSPEAEELLEGGRPPPLRWLRPQAVAGQADVGQTHDAHLVVSERALEVLRTGTLDNCEITVAGLPPRHGVTKDEKRLWRPGAWLTG